MKLEFFSTCFRKIRKYQISRKIRPVSELFHADGRTGRQTNRNTDRLDEANSHFSQFCQRARTGKIYRVTKRVAILICCSWFIGFVYLNFELQILALV